MTRFHTVDYLDRDRREGIDPNPRRLVHLGWWWTTPRLIPLCRLLGHRPVVDGHGTPGEHRGRVARWVACGRCGVRPEPQGLLDPARWSVGQRYRGLALKERPGPPPLDEIRDRTAYSIPGPWPTDPEGVIGGEVVVGADHVSYGAEVKIGNAGSEHTLAGHVNLGPLGALYLHTERHGRWLQRRLNPTGYESRVIGVSAHDGRVFWRLWAKRDSWSRSDPRWQQGSFRISPLDVMFGPKRYSTTDAAGPREVTVRMPHGDDHVVTVTLQRQALARPRQPWRPVRSWLVHWESGPGAGIPTKRGDRGRITASAVKVSAASAADGTWPEEAAAAIAARGAQDRSRYGYAPRRDDLVAAGVEDGRG